MTGRTSLDALIETVLYEGYVLYPYRASSVKNRQRFTFGAVLPREFCEAHETGDAWEMQTEIPLPEGDVEVEVRFLQLVERGAWQEAREQRVGPGRFEIAAGTDGERAWEALSGTVSVERIDEGVGRKLRVRVTNETPCSAGTRDAAMRQALAATHTIVRAGKAVSVLDPPASLAAVAASCRNIGTFPVLFDERTVLSSPIILYDFPKIAAQSPGDLFDATEIDEILTLRILTMTDEEKREARATDARAARLIDRCEKLDGKALAALHGAMRPSLERGTRVRIQPREKGDVLDVALAGKLATVEAVEQDEEGRFHVAVTVDDDPGRDLGRSGLPGHRFFFSPGEVEVVAKASRTVLVAGIGNIFAGDDGFGVEVARRLAERTLPPSVRVADFGIRGFDLAVALAEVEAAVLVDASARGQPPGTLSVLEPVAPPADTPIEPHALTPERVLALVRALGSKPPRLRVVACEPLSLGSPEEVVDELSAPVRAAVDEAIPLVLRVAEELAHA